MEEVMDTQTKAGTASKKKGGNKKGKKAALVIIILAIIAVLVGVIIYLLLSRDKPEDDNDLRNRVITADNLDEAIADMDHGAAEAGYYTVTMNNDWTFPTGDSASTDAYVENDVENTNDVYFDLFIAGDEENPILESPVIPRGGSLTNITLDKDLDPGNYNCIMVYHLIDEDQNTLSTLKVAVTITIDG
jgi:hypothetical protein